MTNAELTILSLISERPRHGYDIEQAIETRGMRAWTEIGFSSIYYLLNKLEKAGMIQGETQQPEGKGPARKVYSITPQGHQTLLEGIITALSTPYNGSSSFLLGLSNFPILSDEQALGALNTYAERIEESITHMLQRAEEQHPLPPFVEAMFDYSRAMAAAELDWIKDFIQKVEAHNV